MTEIRHLGPGDDRLVLGAAALFDKPPTAEDTRRFLEEGSHHLLMAIGADGRPVGFVSGVEITHPDKGTEMLLYELSVAEANRRQGVGRALIEALVALARERECYGMWVLADEDNATAQRTYEAAGARPASTPVLLEWSLGDQGRVACPRKTLPPPPRTNVTGHA